jgi:hypothetical protein
MATVDSDKVVCGGIHAMIVAVLVFSVLGEKTYFFGGGMGPIFGLKFYQTRALVY